MVTFVTALYDIGRERSERPEHTKFDDYFSLAEELFSKIQNCNFVIYTTANLKGRFEGKERVKVIVVEKELLTSFRYISRVKESPVAKSGHQKKDTPEFLCLMNSKFQMLYNTISSSNDSLFFWIDIGLSKVVKNIEVLSWVSRLNVDKVKLMAMNYTSSLEIVNRKQLYEGLRFKVAGGLFGGPRDKLLRLCELISEEQIRYNFCFFDQEVLGVIGSSNPDLVSFYVGDYGSLVSNLFGSFENPERILAFLRQLNGETNLHTRRTYEYLVTDTEIRARIHESPYKTEILREIGVFRDSSK